jgi:ATP-dependent DNA helicase RecQ
MSVSCDSANEVLTRLRMHFGHPQFRQGQEQIVAAVLGGRDVLAVMPTGSGKSLGYQLPAVMLRGMTLVVSPLISLMKDQVDELNRRGIASGALHSMLSADSRREVLSAARAGLSRQPSTRASCQTTLCRPGSRAGLQIPFRTGPGHVAQI